MPATATRRGRGQPSALNRPLVTPQGERTTAAARILHLLALGVPLGHAAGASGIAPSVLRDWLAIGGRISRDIATRKRTKASLTPHEAACWEFSARVDEVREGWVADTLCGLDEARRGGRKVTKVVERHDAAGFLVERTTTVEELLPNVHAGTWLLERSLPAEFGRRSVEVTGPDGGPVAVEIGPAELAADMRAFLEDRRRQREEADQ